MIRAGVFLIIMGASFTTRAELYEISAQCTEDINQEVINFSVTEGGTTDTQEELLLSAKRKILEKAYSYLIDSSKKYVVKQFLFQSEQVRGSKILSHKLTANLSIKAISSCKNMEKVIKKNEFNKLRPTNTYVFLKPVIKPKVVKLSIQTQLKKEIEQQRALTLNSPSISKTAIFGANFGSSFSSVESLYGRFSLVWPLKNNKKIAFIGREHALFFVADKLVGYQYSESLLPVSLRNQLEFSPVAAEIKLGPKLKVNLSTHIPNNVLSALKQEFANVDVVMTGDVVSDKQLAILESLTIGDVSLGSLESDLVCLSQSQIQRVSKESAQRLIGFYNQKGNQNFLSMCNQQVEVGSHSQVRSIKLLEPWSRKNIQLLQGKSLFGSFSAWKFMGLEMDESRQELIKMGSVEHFNDIAEFTSFDGSWTGYFYIEGDKLVSGELEATFL